MRDKVGLLSVYFPFFERQMPSGFRRSQENFAGRLNDALIGAGLDVVFPGVVDSETAGRRAGQQLRDAGVQGLVIAPTMAAPPSYSWAAIEECPRPAVIWNPERAGEFPPDLAETQGTAWSGLVGCLMIANVLVRRDHAFTTVTSSVDNPDGLGRVVRLARVACLAQRFPALRILRVGDPIPGYLDIDLDAARLERDLGPRVVDVPQTDIEQAYRDVAELDTERMLDQLVRAGWQMVEDWPELRPSARLALALDALRRAHGAGAGAVNCHGPLFRDNATTGIVACLGVSWLSAGGCPIACTGDLPTAIALKIAEELTGSALYCESYARESDSGCILLAAGGEGDPTLCDPAAPVEVYPNRHYPGRNGCGACVRFRIRPGPATLLSFSPTRQGWRLIWATGNVLPSYFPGMAGPNARFRFSGDTGPSVVERWCQAGPPHHSALAPGHMGEELAALSRFLGVEGVAVTA